MIGPLFGALVLSVADWRAIFLINLAVGLVLAVALRSTDRASVEERSPPPRRRQLPDWGSPLLLLLVLVFGCLVFVQPTQLVTDVTWGEFFIPFAGDGPLADTRGCGGDRRLLAVPGALGHRQPAAVRPGRLGALLPRGRPARSPAAGRRPRRRHPGLRDRRPAGRRCSPTAGSGTCWSPPSPRSLFALHLRTAEAPLVPPGRSAPAPGVGRDRGQLLRRRGAHRGTDRHPDLRPHHDVPRRPSSWRPWSWSGSSSPCRSVRSSVATSSGPAAQA